MEALVSGNILLVGEGDFSFTVSLVKKVAGSMCTGIIATSIETEESIQKHRLAAANMMWLQEHGITVLLEIDATRLHQHPSMIRNKYSSVIFNFPHTGGKSNHKRNRKLLDDFFASAVQVLENEGQILMTLCKGQGGTAADRPMREWHDSWQVVSMAANSSLILVKVVPFKTEDYSVYSSTGFRSLDKGFNTSNALTHVFQKTELVQVPDGGDDIKVKVDDNVFLCPPYICRKLIQIRNVNVDRCHPVHRVYECITRHIQDSTSLHIDEAGSQPLVNRRVTEHSCQDILTYTETSVDEELVDISDLVQRKELHNMELAQRNLYIISDPVCFIPAQMYDKIQITYGPVYKPCVISKNQSAISYHMTIVWPITVEQTSVLEGRGGSLIDSDSLNKAVDNIAHLFPQILNIVIGQHECSIELLSYPAEQSTYSSMDLSGGVHLADMSVHWSKVCTGNMEEIQGDMDDQVEVVGGVDIKLAGDSSSLSQLLVYVTVDLSRLACLRYSINDKRLLWSTHSAVIGQFHQLDDQFPTGNKNIEISGQTSPSSSVTLNDSVGLDTHTAIPPLTELKDSLVVHTCTSVAVDTCTSGTLLSTSVAVDTCTSGTLSPSKALLKESAAHGILHACIASPSLYPMRFIHDMSFWENKDIPFCELQYSNIIRNVADDNVTMLELIDTYIDEASGSCSRCYRLTFQSVDGALSYNTSWKLQSLVRLQVERQMRIKLR